MRLGFVSAAYPPDLDGIGDYTWWMAKTLAANSTVEKPVVVFTREGSDHQASPGVEVCEFFDPTRPWSFARLPEKVTGNETTNARLDWVILQYNPFSWGSRGFCPWVPRTLARLKKTRKQLRIAVMFHETVVPKWPWKFALMYCWQYPVFRHVCRLAEIAFVSTTRWLPQVQRAAPCLPVHHLPVGSNIPLSETSREEARSRLGIEADTFVLGVFGGAHISRRLDWIAATLTETRHRHPDRRTVLLYIGADGGAMRMALGELDMVDCGVLPAAAVGSRMRAMDAAIAPFLDGVSTRRGSVVALLQHNVPTATNQTSLTDKLFLTATAGELLVSSATSEETFAAETAAWIDHLPHPCAASRVQTPFHDRYFCWPRIANVMVNAFRSCPK